MRRLTVWPPLPPAGALRPREEQLPFPLDRDECALFARGRGAIWAGVRALGLAGDDEVLVPAYHHGSEVEALVRAGLRPVFYEATATLEPDPDELESLLGNRTRALHLVHYLGFPQDAQRWARWCDERSLLLLEDAAQSWLAADDSGAPVGSAGALGVFCLYKTFGLADGAALVVRGAEASAEGDAGRGAAAAGKRAAAWLASRSSVVAAATARLHGRTPYSPGEDFALGDPTLPPSLATAYLLPRVVRGDAAPARRANAERLLEELAELVPDPFATVPPGASPFSLPVEADDKAALLQRLRAAGIVGLDLWSQAHPALPVDRFPAAARRRARTVGLPLHQELLPQDLERIVTAVRGPSRATAPLRVDWHDDFGALRDEWSALAERTRNVFATPELAETWWRHFGRGSELLLASLRRGDGALAGVLPLYAFRSRPPLGVARFLGSRVGDQLGPVCDARDRAAVARAMPPALASRGVDALLAEHTAGAEAWRARLGGRTLVREGSPVIRFGGAWSDYLASRSKNFRDQVKGRERKLGRANELSYRLADDPARLDDDIALLFGLHRARWERPTPFAAREAFHQDFARVALERGWLRLWFLELDGQAVAGWYGFRFAGVESYYQAGRLPEWESGSVGFVLLAHTMRAAADDGIREYRLLRGGEEYKARFAAEDDGLETFVTAVTPRGAAGAAAAAGARSAQVAGRRVRRRFRGVSDL